jgi:hypothetical protein
MDADFCVDALDEAIRRYGTPDIFNTDQGAQFTSDAFTGVLKAAGVQIAPGGTPLVASEKPPDHSMRLAAPSRMDPGIPIRPPRHGTHQGTMIPRPQCHNAMISMEMV